MKRERTLDTDSKRNATYSDALADTATFFSDYVSFKTLKTLSCTLDNTPNEPWQGLIFLYTNYADLTQEKRNNLQYSLILLALLAHRLCNKRKPGWVHKQEYIILLVIPFGNKAFAVIYLYVYIWLPEVSQLIDDPVALFL